MSHVRETLLFTFVYLLFTEFGFVLLEAENILLYLCFRRFVSSP